MILFKRPGDLKNYLFECKRKQQKIGFVPTMGALHDGHISLIKASKNENDVSVCSIFINPTQFNNPLDFQKYPVILENDIYELEKAGCDVLLIPPVSEIYPDSSATTTYYDLGYLETILEGKYRPGHFQGVCQAVERLLNIVEPHQLYLGQKDYQQCLVIARLLVIINRSAEISIRVLPVIREADGLAMSSRNLRLSPQDREKANAIYQTLLLIKNKLPHDELVEIKKNAVSMLTEKGIKPDYIEIADANTLEILTGWDNRKSVALVAAFINEIRLIDNIILN